MNFATPVLIIISTSLIPMFVGAQESAKEEAPDFLDQFPGGGVQIVEKYRGKSIARFQVDQLTWNMKLFAPRMLGFKETQETLNLEDSQVKKIKLIANRIDKYDLELKWETGSHCIPIREKAQQQCNKLKEELDADYHKILSKKQALRLRQLQRRFVLVSISTMPRSKKKLILDELDLDKNIYNKVLAIAEKHIEELEIENKKWEEDEFLPAVRSALGEDRFSALRSILDKKSAFSSNPVVRNGQLNEFFSYDDKKAASSKISDELQFFVFKPVILPNGQFVSSDDHFHRSELHPSPSKWRKLAIFLRDSSDGWVELIDDQEQSIDKIVSRKSAGNNAYYDSFAGEEQLGKLIRTRPTTTKYDAKAYRAWHRKFIQKKAEVDAGIETLIKQTLLPHQLNELQFAIGASQIDLIGIYHTLKLNLLGEQFPIENEAIKKLGELVSRRRKKELEKYNEIETKVREMLSPAQTDLFIERFGKPTKLFPSFLLGF